MLSYNIRKILEIRTEDIGKGVRLIKEKKDVY